MITTCTYKIIQAADPDNLLKRTEEYRTRGHPFKLAKGRYNLAVRGQFFTKRVVNFWNALPEEVVTAPSLDCFKNRFDKANSHLLYCIA